MPENDLADRRARQPRAFGGSTERGHIGKKRSRRVSAEKPVGGSDGKCRIEAPPDLGDFLLGTGHGPRPVISPTAT
jgi:hypothetical protein